MEDKQVRVTEKSETDYLKKAGLQALASLAIVFSVVFVLFLIFQPQLMWLAEQVKTYIGLAGAFGFVFVVDTFPMPMTADILFISVGQWNTLVFLVVISLASIAGGSTGFFIARKLGQIPFFAKRLKPIAKRYEGHIQKYGVFFSIMGAITPIPYSATTWASALLGMKFRIYFIGTLFRFPRMVVYYLVVVAGMSAAQGL